MRDQAVVLGRLVDAAGGLAQALDRRVVRMRGERHARLLGDRQERVQEDLEALPELLARDRPDRARPEPARIAHVPDHARGDRPVEVAFGGIEADRDGAAPAARTLEPAPDAGDREIIADHRNPGLADPSDQRLEVLELNVAPGAVEQHVRPEGGVEVLERGDLEAVAAGTRDQAVELRLRPELGAGAAAPALVAAGSEVRARAGEIVGQMGDDVAAARLPRKPEIVVGQQIPIQAQPELHALSPGTDDGADYLKKGRSFSQDR